MKKTFIAFLTILFVLALSACGAQKDEKTNEDTNNSTSLYDQIKEKGEITIGTEGTYAPFTFHDKSDKLTGFDIEIAEEVFKRLEIKPTFIETKWDGMIAGLDAKRYDVVHEENNEIKSLEDLNGKKVGQSLDSNYRKIAEEHGATNTVVDGFNQAIDLIVSKRIDGTINDSLSYLDLKKQRPDLPIKTVYEEPEATSNAFLFRKGSDELVEAVNGALADMKEDGTYLKISEKWFGTDVSK
jgi:cystine transport system substrate-binding protein